MGGVGRLCGAHQPKLPLFCTSPLNINYLIQYNILIHQHILINDYYSVYYLLMQVQIEDDVGGLHYRRGGPRHLPRHAGRRQARRRLCRPHAQRGNLRHW